MHLLGRSMKIDPHDVGIRVNQAHNFLMEGHKVQIVQNFRGRELMHRQQNVSYVRRRSFSIRMYAVLLDWDINRICSSEQLDNADGSGYL